VSRGLPLPLGAIDNRRSLIAVENLADALLTLALHPAASGQTYLVSDGEDLSTPSLIRMIADGLGRPSRLINVPAPVLRTAAALFGKASQVEKVIGSLQVDIRKVKLLGWQPPRTTREAIASTARWYAGMRSSR
jgi:nucleoside-diphosphate-sugar epimerase